MGAAYRVWAVGLTDEETAEVEAVISLITRAVVDGQISQHFGDWIVQRLAEDCASAILERLRK